MILATHGIIGSSIVQFTGLLDTYSGAAAAYSLRKLRTAYTGNAIRVRRASDNTEQNIGFVNNVLDTASLTSFCSGTNGFVTTWYDQSGNGMDATQSTGANQPQIVSSGSVLTLNGRPSILSSTTAKFLETPNTISYTECYISVVFNRTGKFGPFDNLYIFDTPFNQLYSNTPNWQYFSQSTSYNTTIPLSTSQKIITQIDNGNNTIFYDNSIQDSSFNISNNISNSPLVLFANRNAYGTFGNMQEFILYNSDQSSNRTGIETNIANHYGITLSL
jgi:hypothetical protein